MALEDGMLDANVVVRTLLCPAELSKKREADLDGSCFSPPFQAPAVCH